MKRRVNSYIQFEKKGGGGRGENWKVGGTSHDSERDDYVKKQVEIHAKGAWPKAFGIYIRRKNLQNFRFCLLPCSWVAGASFLLPPPNNVNKTQSLCVIFIPFRLPFSLYTHTHTPIVDIIIRSTAISFFHNLYSSWFLENFCIFLCYRKRRKKKRLYKPSQTVIYSRHSDEP